MPITAPPSSSSPAGGVNIVYWLLALGFVAVVVSLIETYSGGYAWGLVALIVLSALVLDRQQALYGLAAVFAAAKG